MPDLVLVLVLDKTGVTLCTYAIRFWSFTELVEGWLLMLAGDASSHKALVDVWLLMVLEEAELQMMWVEGSMPIVVEC